eukprot:155048_1
MILISSNSDIKVFKMLCNPAMALILCLLLTIQSCYGLYFGFQTATTSIIPNNKNQFNAIRLTLHRLKSRYQCQTYPTESNTIYKCDTSDKSTTIQCNIDPTLNVRQNTLQIDNSGLNTVYIDTIFIHDTNNTSIDMNYFCQNVSFVNGPCELKQTISINYQNPYYIIQPNDKETNSANVYFANESASCISDLNMNDICISDSNRPFLSGIYKYSSWNIQTNSSIYYSIINHKYLYNTINNQNKQLIGSDIWDIQSKNDRYCMRTLCDHSIEIEMLAEFHTDTESIISCSETRISKFDRIMWMFNTVRNSVEIMSLYSSNRIILSNPNSDSNILGCCVFFEEGQYCDPIDLQYDEYINGYRIISDNTIKSLYFYTNKNKTHFCSSRDIIINNYTYTDTGIVKINNMYLNTIEFQRNLWNNISNSSYDSIFVFKYLNCSNQNKNPLIMELEYTNMKINPCNFIPTNEKLHSIIFAIKTQTLIDTILTLTLFWNNLKYQCNVFTNKYQIYSYYSCDTNSHELVTKCNNMLLNPIKYGLQIDQSINNNSLLEIEYISITDIGNSVNRYIIVDNLYFNNSFQNHLITFNLNLSKKTASGYINIPSAVLSQNSLSQSCLTAHPSTEPSLSPNSIQPTGDVTMEPSSNLDDDIIISNHELIDIEWIAFSISNIDLSCGVDITSV